MRDPNRIKPFLEILEQCWNKVPDWRFGQIVCNMQRAIGDDGFYMEDDIMLGCLKLYFELEDDK